jgi:hypothetical protein
MFFIESVKTQNYKPFFEQDCSMVHIVCSAMQNAFYFSKYTPPFSECSAQGFV